MKNARVRLHLSSCALRGRVEWRCYAISIFWKFTIGSNCYYFKLAAITSTDFTHGARLSKYSLGNVCMCVCVCVFDYVLSMVQGVLAKRCAVDWCSTWPREATDPKEFICFWPTRILKFYARSALLEIHLQGHKTQTFQTQPQTYYLHSCSAWPSFKQQDPSPDRVTLIVTSYGIAGLCARNARNRNARLPSASVTLQGT